MLKERSGIFRQGFVGSPWERKESILKELHGGTHSQQEGGHKANVAKLSGWAVRSVSWLHASSRARSTYTRISQTAEPTQSRPLGAYPDTSWNLLQTGPVHRGRGRCVKKQDTWSTRELTESMRKVCTCPQDSLEGKPPAKIVTNDFHYFQNSLHLA